MSMSGSNLRAPNTKRDEVRFQIGKIDNFEDHAELM